MKKGVFEAKKKSGEVYYRASFTYKNKHISLGSYSTEELAHRAYMEAVQIMESPVHSYEIKDFSKKKHYLSFEKWICILNLRDNGIYFKTPIYLYKNYFEYYLDNDPYAPLKFDVDDLFFYSTHKIMRRGNHLFVADYGMQINILNRYGIKNFAVPGKDYIFVNGSNTDFRYENIKIINRYNGVTSYRAENGMIQYRTRIHVKNDILVGKYNDEKMAAIAYNKAVDCLKERGLNINYQKNYIENMETDEYMAVYNSLKINDMNNIAGIDS